MYYYGFKKKYLANEI